MEIKLPQLTTVTAVINIYLVLSICMVTVYATKKPIGSEKLFNDSDDWDSDNVYRTMRSDTRAQSLLTVNDIIEVARVEEIGDKVVNGPSNNDQTSKSKISNRALDIYEEEEEYFRPSAKFESQRPGNRIRTVRRGSSERYGERSRRPQRQRLGDRRQSSYLQEDDRLEDVAPYRYRQQQKQRADTYPDAEYNEYEQSYSHAKRPYGPPNHIKRPLNPPLRRQQSPYRKQLPERFPFERPSPQSIPEYDLDDDYFYPPGEESKSPGLLDAVFALLKPKKTQRPEADPSEPSIEWLYNDIDSEDKNSLFSAPETDLFIPNNSDYDDGNIDYRDQNDIEAEYVPEYDFKDVIKSIRNNESRVQTLKKFLSAASGLSNRAGSSPETMLWTMPVTILSILGVFYGVSAVAVLGYKYILLTTGNSNGQALAILPVVLLFTVPLILSVIFFIARGALDGQINLGRLARGDLKHGLRQDFDSVDFAYDMGVGATALLGLGWILSVTL